MYVYISLLYSLLLLQGIKYNVPGEFSLILITTIAIVYKSQIIG